jgi:ankyrin repeat protein
MREATEDFLLAIERHDPEGLHSALDAGIDPLAPLRGRTPVQWLTSMYTRSERFAHCLRVLLHRGAMLEDPALVPVLLNDADRLRAMLAEQPSLLRARVDLECAFTPLRGATLLHVAAEFQHLRAARVLIEAGADLEARAAVEPHGLDGHTALYHTVNSHADRAAPLRRLLLDAGARADVWVAGIVWGRGFEWETTLYDLSPISYAQCGLLPQMHRDEVQIDATVRELLLACGRGAPAASNVPNRYLQASRSTASD